MTVTDTSDTSAAAPDPTTGACALSAELGLTPLIQLHAEAQADAGGVLAEGGPAGDGVAGDGPAEDGAAESGPAVMDDPLSVFMREEEALKAGDLGIAVRKASDVARFEVERLKADRHNVLQMEAPFFTANADRADLVQNWEAALGNAADHALTALAAVFAKGEELSADIASGTVDGTQAQAVCDGQTGVAELALQKFEVAMNTLHKDIAFNRKTIEDNLQISLRNMEVACAPVEADIAKCLRWDYPEVATFDAILKKAKSRAYAQISESELQQAIHTASAVQAEVTKLIAEKQAAFETEKAKFAAITTDVETKVGKHRGLSRIINGSLEDEQLVETEGKILAARAMVESGRNIKAVEAAIALAREAQVLIDAIDDPAASGLLSEMRDTLKSVEKMLNKHSKIRSTDSAALLKKLTKLRSDILPMAPATAKETADSFAATVLTADTPGDWSSFQGRAQLQKAWKTNFEALAETHSAEIAQLDAALPNGYSGSLVSDVEALKGLVAGEVSEGTEAEANALVAKIVKTLSDYSAATDTSASPEKETALRLLSADQAAADAAAAAEEQAKVAFEALLKTTQDKVKTANAETAFSTMISHIKTKEIAFEGVKQMIEVAEKAAQDSKDYATGTAYLRSATKDLDMLVKQSTGELFRDLGDIGKVWQSGVASFSTNVGTLKSKMGAAIEAMDAGGEREARADQSKSIGTALDGLVRFFPPTAFDQSAQRLSTLTDANERKREREEVLRKVQLYRDAISSNPLMKSVVGNPFGVNGIASGLYAQLRKIELKTLATL